MSVYAIGDLHLSLSGEKGMDIFSGWQDYTGRLERNWRGHILPEDTVVVAGDISWAMKLEETLPDFAWLNALPGRKLLMKGNHDYWWSSRKKCEAFFASNGLSTLSLLHNSSVTYGGVSLCGSRGWMFDEDAEANGSITARECGRIRLSLDSAPPDTEKILFLHYPPIYGEQVIPEFFDLMREYGVRRCYYGHLHGAAAAQAFQGEYFGVQLRLISADALRFDPLLIP